MYAIELEQGCGTCAQMESIKRLFVAKRTAAAAALQLDGFCDGLVSLAETISECLLSGNAEDLPHLKSSTEVPLTFETCPYGYELLRV